MTKSRTSALSRPMLAPEEEAKLIARVKENGDPDAEERIVEAYYRLCYSIASRYSKNPTHIKDLAQEGSIGIRRGIIKYDPTRGMKFSTYVRDWISSHIASATARTISVLSIPPRLYIDAKMNRVSEEKNLAAINAVAAMVELDAPIMNEDGNETAQTRLVDTSPSPEDVVISQSAQRHASKLVAIGMDALTDREKMIITRRRLTDYPCTLEEIGQDLGVTRERVRQIEIEAVQKMATVIMALNEDDRLL